MIYTSAECTVENSW